MKKHLILIDIYNVTKGITKEDILAFIGVRIFMGINKLPSIENYWSNDVLYKNNLVKKVMSKEYYYFICFSLHFKEKNTSKNNEENEIDLRKKIQIFIEKLSSNFQKYYTLGKNITIDESLLHFTGRNKMKFYIPMKPHKWGFKIHLLCDSNTNYLYNMLFDPGKEGKDSIIYENNPSIAQSIVLRLLSCINDDKKRNIFFDGWYSSIELMNKLTKLGYLNTTVFRNNAKDLP